MAPKFAFTNGSEKKPWTISSFIFQSELFTILPYGCPFIPIKDHTLIYFEIFADGQRAYFHMICHTSWSYENLMNIFNLISNA